MREKMTKYSRMSKMLTENQRLVAVDRELWNEIFDFWMRNLLGSTDNYCITEYEKRGGTWTVKDLSEPEPEDDSELYHIFGYGKDEDSINELRRIRKYQPNVFLKLKNWE